MIKWTNYDPMMTKHREQQKDLHFASAVRPYWAMSVEHW